MSNTNVLVVEDDDTIRRLLVEYLKSHAYVNVDGARDGVEALHQIATVKYAVLVVDVMMPKMSGLDLLDSLKALTSDPSVKSMEHAPNVVIITSAADVLLPDEVITERFPGVVRRVFRKPLEMQQLAECVEQHVRR